MRKTGLKLKQQKWGRMWRKKGKEENWRIGEEEIAGSEMEEKREEEWKAATREKGGNVKEYWRNHHNITHGVIGIWRGWE